MAKKKPARKKETSLVGNKTSVSVEKWVSKVQKKLQDELRKINALAFDAIASNGNVLSTYFLANSFYSNFLEGYMGLFRRAVRNALADNIADSTISAMAASGATYPGIWDKFAIVTLTQVTIARSFSIGDNGPTLSIKRAMEECGIGDDDEIETAMEMPYSEYNPNRLYQYAMLIQRIVIELIEREIATSIPASRRVVRPETLQELYGRQLREAIVKSGTYLPDNLPDTVEEQAQEVFGIIQTPIMAYMTLLLSESGVGAGAISLMSNLSEIKAIYNTDTSTGTPVKSFIHSWVRIEMRVTAKDDPMNFVTLSVQASDICALFKRNEEDVSSSAKRKVGAAIMKFLKDLVGYCFNMAISHPDDLIRSDTDDEDFGDAEDLDTSIYNSFDDEGDEP